MLYEYIHFYDKISSIKKIGLFLGTCFFYFFTHSDALILIVIIAVLKCFFKYNTWRKIVEKVGGYSFAIFSVISFVLLKLENTWIYILINMFFTGRLYLGKKALESYGISVFGHEPIEYFKWITEGNKGYIQVVDNSYFYLAIQYGIFWLLLIAFIFAYANRKADYRKQICFIMYALFALAENTILSPTALFPVIIAAQLCWDRRNKNYMTCFVDGTIDSNEGVSKLCVSTCYNRAKE